MASILVSEADPGAQQLLVASIERLGHTAIVLEQHAEIPPRADLLVFEASSRWCMQHARLARLFFPRIPLVCLGSAPDAGEFVADGVVGYVAKPFTLDDLAAGIARVVPAVA